MTDAQSIANLERRLTSLERKLEELIRLLKRSDDEDVQYAARRAGNA